MGIKEGRAKNRGKTTKTSLGVVVLVVLPLPGARDLAGAKT
jgi:hypothetical protein